MPDFANDGRKALLAFRSITNSTNARSIILSLIPVVPCGNSLLIALGHSEYKHEIAFFATNISSFVFDYAARQKIGGFNLNFFIISQFPVLPPQHYKATCAWDTARTLGNWLLPHALELTYTAWDLEAFAKDCGYNGPPFRWDEERRFLLRCELDAAYFHLYGIARDDVDYILDTFRVWREKEVKLCGEYRTKRVILEMYDAMKSATETGMPYQTRLTPPPADPSVAHAPRQVEGLE